MGLDGRAISLEGVCAVFRRVLSNLPAMLTHSERDIQAWIQFTSLIILNGSFYRVNLLITT